MRIAQFFTGHAQYLASFFNTVSSHPHTVAIAQCDYCYFQFYLYVLLSCANAGAAWTVAMAKRKLEFADYEEIDGIDKEIGSASIHGVVTHVSPVKVLKKGNRYFHGEVSNGKSTLRFVGFVASQQRQLKEFQQTRKLEEMKSKRHSEIRQRMKYW